MVSGTQRGLLLLGAHNGLVQIAITVYTAFFLEYYFHERLLIVEAKKGCHDAVQVHISKWGLCVFAAAQLIGGVVTTLNRLGVLESVAQMFANWRTVSLLRSVPNEQLLAFLFGLAWWLLRFPLLPSAVSCTLLWTTFQALADACGGGPAVTHANARDGPAPRSKDLEWLTALSKAASGIVAAMVFLAAFLYDGATPRCAGALSGFHIFFLLLSILMGCGFGVLQLLLRRLRRTRADLDNFFNARGDVEVTGSPRTTSIVGFDQALTAPLPSAFAVSDFHAFIRQTCQRHSMKALLLVKAVHCYADTVLVCLFHLLLTLGCGAVLPAAVRAALLASVVLLSNLLSAPGAAALCALVGVKRSFSLSVALLALGGALALVTAVFTRGAKVAGVLAKDRGPFTEATTLADEPAVSPVGVFWCVLLLVSQRLLLSLVRDVLTHAQDNVIEEDAILFGRVALTVTWTRRLGAAATALAQPLALIISFFLLAVTSAVTAVRSGAQTWTATTTATPSPSIISDSPGAIGAPPALSSVGSALLVSNASTILTVVGLQTCGAAIAMLLVWQRLYNLDGKHLQFVQMATRKRKDEQSVSLV